MTRATLHDYFPFDHVAGDRKKGLLLLCDHATATIPAAYNKLGLGEDQLSRHIAYDIGAKDVTLALAKALDVPAVLSNFSRLLIDPNRGHDDPTLMMRISDGALIPENAKADAAEVEKRRRLYHAPYHQRVEDELLAIEAARDGQAAFIFSVHSFTPNWRGTPRPWEITILWDSDPRLPKPLLEGLRADPTLTVGDNVPYDGALKNDCMFQHGTKRGRAHALVELRQDLIATKTGAEEWANRLAPLLKEQFNNLTLNQHTFYPSRTER